MFAYVQRWEEKEFKPISTVIDFPLTCLSVSIIIQAVHLLGRKSNSEMNFHKSKRQLVIIADIIHFKGLTGKLDFITTLEAKSSV